MKQPKSLALAYGSKRPKASCQDCKSGMCEMHPKKMAEGGELGPSTQTADPDKYMTESSEMDSEGQKDSPSLEEHIDLVSDIMKDRKRRLMMAEGGMVDSMEDEAPAEPAFGDRVDLEPVHTMEDDAHDQESPSKDDQDLIGQILHERKMRRR